MSHSCRPKPYSDLLGSSKWEWSGIDNAHQNPLCTWEKLLSSPSLWVHDEAVHIADAKVTRLEPPLRLPAVAKVRLGPPSGVSPLHRRSPLPSSNFGSARIAATMAGPAPCNQDVRLGVPRLALLQRVLGGILIPPAAIYNTCDNSTITILVFRYKIHDQLVALVSILQWQL